MESTHPTLPAAAAATHPCAAAAGLPRASAPPWIWAVVGGVLALIVGLAVGMVSRPQALLAPAAPLPAASAAAGDEAAAAGKTAPAGKTTPAGQVAPAAPCATCGTVVSVQAVRHRGKATGVGAVAGGVVGGLVGNQMGEGSGNAAMTVLGAVGGAYAGAAIEKNARAYTVYETQVRMADGSLRRFNESRAIAVGSPVRVEGRHLRVARADTPLASPADTPDAPPADTGSAGNN